MTVPITPRTFTAYTVPTTGLVVHTSPTSVDSTGSGSSSGSPVTLTRARDIINASASGGTVVLQGSLTSRYVRQNVSFSKQVALMPAPGAVPVLDGTQIVSGFSTTADASGNYIKTGYTTSFTKISSGITATHPEAAGKQALFLDGVRLYSVGTLAELAVGKYYIDEVADKIYLKDNPTGKVVETIAATRAITITSSATGSSVKGINITGYTDAGLFLQAPNTLVENCVVDHISFCAIDILHNSDIIRNTSVNFAGTNGISTHSYNTGTLLENNTISGTNKYSPQDLNWSVGAIKMFKTSGARIVGNTVYDNNGTGIWFDGGCTDSFVLKNKVYNNSSIGIFAEISQRILIAGNLSYNNTSGVSISGAQYIRVYNNTFVNNSKSISIKDNNQRTAADAGPDWFVAEIRIKNNLCMGSRNSGSNYHIDMTTWASELSSAYVSLLDANVYYRPDTSRPQYHIKWSSAAGQELSYVDMASFKAANAGFDVNSSFVTSATNPFIGSDYKLLSTSPARVANGFTAASKLPDDIALELGLPTNTPVDAGAFQYVAPTTAVDPCAVKVDAAIEPLNNTISSLSQELADSKNETDLATASLAERNARIVTLTADLSAAVAQLDARNSELALANSKVSSLQVNVSSLQSQLTNTTALLSNKETQVASLTSQLATANATILSLQAASNSEQLAQLAAQVDALLVQNAQLKTDAVSLKSSIRADLQDYKAKLAPPIYVEIDADLTKYQ